MGSEIEAEYFNLCPKCGKSLSLEECSKGICKNLQQELFSCEESGLVQEFLDLFSKLIGKPRAIQKFWAKRLIRGESFAAVAPTGIGKTSFGVAFAFFLAKKSKKSYILLPTQLLLQQIVEDIENYSKKAKFEAKLLYYHAKMKKDEKEKFQQLLAEGDFDILVTTTQFLSRHFTLLKGLVFDFIFVDDVDAILKSSKNVDRILELLGFSRDKGSFKGKAKGVLMVSTATAKKGRKIELFRKLLNFDIGLGTSTLRNIEDILVNSTNLETLEEIFAKMGKGGIIYTRSQEEAKQLYEKLKEKYEIGIVTAEKKSDYKLFESGDLDYLIGTAYYYGTLVRGLDLPERIRFVIFYKAPTFRVKFEDVDSCGIGTIRTLALVFRDNPKLRDFIPLLPLLDKPKYAEKLALLRKTLREILKAETTNFDARDICIKEDEIIFPDLRTYIQGSGRTSRLFAGGITKGASFLLEDDRSVLNAFVERASYYDIEFKPLAEVDFPKLLKEIDETRRKFAKRFEAKDLIKPLLFIVESPTKAKQISHFFGQPSVKLLSLDDNGNPDLIAYEVPTSKHILLVTACLGHVTDLITNLGFHGVLTKENGKFVPIYASIKRCKSCGYQFTEEKPQLKCVKCGSTDIDDSKRRIETLRSLASQTEFIVIGTDPDSEGEKIAWDLKNLLSGYGEIKRAEFHEVTRRAVTEALDNLRDINENLVKAQIVRRVEDRWIGFVLSQKLWKVFNDKNLSAGRAQTPVLGWIISQAKEHKKKRIIAYIKDLDLTIEDFPANASTLVKLKISLLKEKTEEKQPLPPYTTNSLLRDANKILKISVKECMELAQDLFETGLITYHRTDSTHVSDMGLRIAKNYLGSDFSARKWESEGAHECIRPTRALDSIQIQRLIQEGVIFAENIRNRHLALYDLIFRRFMASQCKPYLAKVNLYEITFNGKKILDERVIDASGRAIQLYKWTTQLRKPLPLGYHEVNAEVRVIPKVPLFSQSDVIAMMKEKGIGRPSTYATILDKLFLRRYIFEKRSKIIPTSRGVKIYNYLSNKYSSLVSEERTRLLEEKMDAVERGEMPYLKALAELYEEIKGIT